MEAIPNIIVQRNRNKNKTTSNQIISITTTVDLKSVHSMDCGNRPIEWITTAQWNVTIIFIAKNPADHPC